GFGVLFAIDVVDAEAVEGLRHFPRALEERLEISALHFVSTAHLLDHQFGVGFYAQVTHVVRLGVVESGNESVVLGNVIGRAADVFLQFGGHFPFRVANHHSVGSRTGIAAGATVDVGAPGGGFLFGRSIVEEAGAAEVWFALIHQWEAEEAAPLALESGSGLTTVMGWSE